MQHVLELLKLTQHKAWKDIIISQENLQAWPEDGDIATDFPMMVLTESEDGHEFIQRGLMMPGSMMTLGESMMVNKLQL